MFGVRVSCLLYVWCVFGVCMVCLRYVFGAYVAGWYVLVNYIYKIEHETQTQLFVLLTRLGDWG